MRKTLSIGLLLGMCLHAEFAQAALPPIADRGLRFMPYEVVVEFRDQGARAMQDRSLDDVVLTPQYGGFHLAKIPFRAPMRNDPDSIRTATKDVLETLRARDDVVYAQLNYLLDFALIPSDPLYSQQWHYPSIDLPNAWNITTGSSAVRIAIIDSGRSGHPDIAWSPLQYNAPQPGQPATDNGEWRHGTHVAAIAGARGNNGIGGVGVCFGCTLLNAKIGDTVTGLDPDPQWPTMLWAANSILWSTDNGARVINMSFETGSACASFPLLLNATRYASDRGVSLVAAAGNGATNVDQVSPASCPGVIAVAATDRNRQLAGYSSRGPTIGISAPGGGGELSAPPYSGFGQGIGCPADPSSYFYPYTDGVLSAWTTSPTSGNGHCYRYLSGTSMAAPHVAGTIGLMLSIKPLLRPLQIRQLLARSATPMPQCGNACGPGLLNAFAAVSAAQSATTGPCSAANDDGNKSLNCDIDSLDRYVDAFGRMVESISAYGYLWQFDANGAQLGVARSLGRDPRYANGPCQFAPAGGVCRFETGTKVDFPGIGPYESITAYGRIWNYDQNGNALAGSGTSLTNIARYAAGPCASTAGANCRFDTRSLVSASVAGGAMEYITAYQKYWIYDGNGILLKTGDLLSDTRYRNGPCDGLRTCGFESQEFRNTANGGRIEVVTAHGRYFEWDENGNPSASNGMSLRDIPRLR